MRLKNYNTRFADYALEHSKSKGRARSVIFLISLQADEDGMVCLTSKEISDSLAINTKTLFRALAKLEEIGELQRVRRGGKSGGNVYHVFPNGLPDDFVGYIDKQDSEAHS